MQIFPNIIMLQSKHHLLSLCTVPRPHHSRHTHNINRRRSLSDPPHSQYDHIGMEDNGANIKINFFVYCSDLLGPAQTCSGVTKPVFWAAKLICNNRWF